MKIIKILTIVFASVLFGVLLANQVSSPSIDKTL